MPYKTPKIPLLEDATGIEKRIKTLQQKLSELDWLEYSFGLALRSSVTYNDDVFVVPLVYTGPKSDSLDVRMWPDDSYKSYAFWDLIDLEEVDYNDSVNGRRRYPKLRQPIACIVCWDNQKIAPDQDHVVTHSILRNQLLSKLNYGAPQSGIFQMTGLIENRAEDVFADYDVAQLKSPFSCIRVEGLITYTIDC